jgi:cysteine desulfurase
VTVNGAPAERLPGIVNLGFDGVSGESLMHLLDLKGVCVSTGSACASGSGEPSHVLLALGLTERQAMSAVRVSYGRYNTLQEVEEIIAALCGAYGKIVGR